MSESAAEEPVRRQEPAGGPAADGVWEGPDRLRWLEGVDGIDLPAVDGLVEGLVQVQKSIAGLHALEASMLSAAVDVLVQAMTVRAVGTDQNLPWRELSAEIAAALGVSDRSMQARLGDAATLVRGSPGFMPRCGRAVWTGGVRARSWMSAPRCRRGRCGKSTRLRRCGRQSI